MTSGRGGWQPGDPLYADERVCTHPQAVHWNPDNAVVQCHVCGHVYIPRAAVVDEVQPHSFHLLEAVHRERERANRLQLALAGLERAEIRADVAKVRESHGSDRGYPVVRLADDVEALLARLAVIEPKDVADA